MLTVEGDGDDHRDPELQARVDGFPTLSLGDSQGQKLRRAACCQSVPRLVAMLQEQ